jgi:phosphoglycolate phosphatase-like HAD superfamily hydrolase
MLEAAAARHGIALDRSWTIGDVDTDVLAGRAAGTHTILIENPRSGHKRHGEAGEEHRAADLAEAAAIVAAAQ